MDPANDWNMNLVAARFLGVGDGSDEDGSDEGGSGDEDGEDEDGSGDEGSGDDGEAGDDAGAVVPEEAVHA